MRVKDLAGLRSGRLVAIKQVLSNSANARWLCVCDCGKESFVYGYNLSNGMVKSCGCLRQDFAKSIGISHNMSKTRFHKIWSGMIYRTTNKNNKRYRDYGGRGITVCEEWQKFEGFMKDMYGSYLVHCKEHGEKDTTIERIDNDSGYNINNCKWATCKEQAMNRRKMVRSNVKANERELLQSRSQ